MPSFHIVTNPHRDGPGNHKVGTVRQLPDGNWEWYGLGRKGRHSPDAESAQRGAMRAFGNVRFEEVLE